MARPTDKPALFGTWQGDPHVGAGPGRPGRVIRLHPKTGHRHVDWLSWGLLPHGATDPDKARRPIHARAETITDVPMFADAFRRRRAIVPTTEYYQRKHGTDQWFAITRRDWQPLAIAGLWEAYVRPNGDIERTYCIITVSANATVAPIHNRMPLVLESEDWPLWLGEVPGDPTSLLRPPADDVLVVRPISRRS